MFQMSKHIKSCDSSSMPPPPTASTVSYLYFFPFSRKFTKMEQFNICSHGLALFFRIFFRPILVERAQESVPVVADWFCLQTECSMGLWFVSGFCLLQFKLHVCSHTFPLAHVS